MSYFVKNERRFLDDTRTLRTSFLSDKIKSEITNKLGFLPWNAYIGNSAGDYMFINVVDEQGQVYTYTDSYNLDAELQDKGINIEDL